MSRKSFQSRQCGRVSQNGCTYINSYFLTWSRSTETSPNPTSQSSTSSLSTCRNSIAKTSLTKISDTGLCVTSSLSSMVRDVVIIRHRNWSSLISWYTREIRREFPCSARRVCCTHSYLSSLIKSSSLSCPLPTFGKFKSSLVFVPNETYWIQICLPLLTDFLTVITWLLIFISHRGDLRHHRRVYFIARVQVHVHVAHDVRRPLGLMFPLVLQSLISCVLFRTHRWCPL